MGTSNIEISILKKRLELLEMKIGELNSINPEILNERLAKIEERLYVVKENNGKYHQLHFNTFTFR